MNKFLIFSAITLCIASRCALGQYQTSPAYGNGQKKMAPSPQSYGQQQMSAGGASMASNYDQGMGEGQSGKQYGGGKMMMMSKPMMMSGGGDYGNGGAGGYGQKSGAGSYEEPKHPPMPYEFGYNIDDGYDNSQYRKENSDGNSVTGSYGYRDAYGVFRYVDYVADENGFRATVKTNEPGTANESPADVDWQAEEPPAQTNPGSKSGSYGSSGSSSSYSSAGSQMGGSSYGAGRGNSNMADMGQYGTSTPAAQTSGMGGGKYAASADSGSSDAGTSSYGSGGAAPMMTGSGDPAQYGSGSSMGSGASRSSYEAGNSNRQSAMMAGRRYGAGMMAALGAGMMKAQGNGYASGQSMGMGGSSAGDQYGAGGSSMAGAGGQYGMGSGSANAGRSSRYKSQGAGGSRMGMGSGASQGAYGMGATRAMDMGSNQYGASSMSSESNNNYNNNNMDNSQQYGSQQMSDSMIMAAAGTKGGSGGVQSYGSASGASMTALDDSDSALAQQYGPSAMSMMGPSGDNNAQQYGASSAMDGASTYSSMRLQGGARPTGNYGGGRNSANSAMGYGAGGPRRTMTNGAGANGGQYGSSGTKAAQSGAMDYRKAAAKNIAALVKRY